MIPTSEAFTIFMPAAGWMVELLTTADEIEYMSRAYQSQRGTRPGVAMYPATWSIVAGLFDGWSDGETGPTLLRVVLTEDHDPGTITFFDDVQVVSALRKGTPRRR